MRQQARSLEPTTGATGETQRSARSHGICEIMSHAMREGIVRDLPEIRDVTDKALQEKVIDAWVMALSQTKYRAISEVPPWGNPKVFVIKRGSQADHLRGVAHLAVGFADEFKRSWPEIRVNRDIVLAGALCHDVGKPWEFHN